MTTEDKIEALLDDANGWTRDQFLALAMRALDQGGVTEPVQRKIAALVDICVDCKLDPATHTARCDECEILHDAFLRDAEIDRRIDETRGK